MTRISSVRTGRGMGRSVSLVGTGRRGSSSSSFPTRELTAFRRAEGVARASEAVTRRRRGTCSGGRWTGLSAVGVNGRRGEVGLGLPPRGRGRVDSDRRLVGVCGSGPNLSEIVSNTILTPQKDTSRRVHSSPCLEFSRLWRRPSSRFRTMSTCALA